jgi:hypothetical protein
MNEDTRGIRPSNNSERKNSIIKRNLEIKLQTLKYGARNTFTTIG